jgi:hypothetical protein
MMSLAYDRQSNILRANFAGVLSSDDIEELDRAVVAFTASHGPFHSLVDFRAVDAVSVPLTKLLKRSQQPPASPGYERVFVAPGPLALEVARTFAREQAALGAGRVHIVATLDDAYLHFGLTQLPTFEPVV